MSIDEPAIARIVKDLKDTGVHVDQSLSAQLPPAFQAKLKQWVAESKKPVFVAMVPVDPEDPTFHGDNELLAGVLHSDVGAPGVYLTYNTIRDGVEGNAFEIGTSDYMAWFAAVREHPQDLQQQLAKTITYLNNGQGEVVYERLREQEGQREGQSTSTSHQSSSDDGGFIGPVGGTILVALTVAAVAIVVRRRRSRPSTSTYVAGKGYVTDRPFVLPAATLSMIRQSRDQQLERRAAAAVLALGEGIDNTEMKGLAQGSWQAALDHYDLSRRILDRRHSQADVVGALVLSERGQAALAAAGKGRSWRPVVTCYFNPLHGAAGPRVRWTGEEGAATVPACADCARAVGRGNEPDDVLDFVIDGRARHYFDLDLEPWSSTGYGALDTDLTGRLFRRE